MPQSWSRPRLSRPHAERAHTERWAFVLICAAGLLLRLWGLGDKGLAYDEAATALMARAPAGEIIAFHWRAAFEHPPLWQLTMRAWSLIFGQSEAALRLLPALAGVLAVPLTWYWLRLLWPRQVSLRLTAAALVAAAPTLVMYSQEARMYTVVVLLALLSLCLLVGIVDLRLTLSPSQPLNHSPDLVILASFVVINWLLTGYHYYSLLVVGCEALFLLILLLHRRTWVLAPWWLGAVLASVTPIALWMLLAPGFHDTLAAIAGGIGQGGGPSAWAFFDGLWRDLSFGAFRWPPPQSVWGYLLLPLVLLGGLVLVILGPNKGMRSGDGSLSAAETAIPPDSMPLRVGVAPWGWLVVMAALLPLAVSVAFFRTLAARYILFSLPAIYALAAVGIVWLASRHRLFGTIGVVLAAVPVLLGLGYYFGPYHKSEYREMAAFLNAHLAPDEAIMLYAPRQHLLAKYYLGADRTYYTAPQVQLPPYWPVNAPPVVPEEMDGGIQDLLAAHPSVWLVMTAQDEVDDGEFVPKYLTAVAYKQECWEWIDVDLCRFVSPHSVLPDQTTAPNLLYNGELRLQRTASALLKDPQVNTATIFAQLDWLAERKPTIDYRITLRLIDGAGQVIAQRDDFPIGPLLPPTTWNAGDAKPGYLALPLPADLPPGGYTLTVGVYDPTNGAALADPLPIATYGF